MSNVEGLAPCANCESEDRLADIVFLHGLGGGSHSTWRHGKRGDSNHFFWPEELGQDLPDCGIWTIGYPAGISSFGAPGMIFEKRAGNIAQKLANARFGSRPIIFITHSMGGLIVKKLMVGSQIVADKDRKRIADATRGIVFCATPHKGSGYSDAAQTLGQFFGGTQRHLNEMSEGKDTLDILHDQFVTWQAKYQVPICNYAENIGLYKKRLWFLRPIPLGLVVQRASANPHIQGHVVRDVDEDHFTIVKPKSRTSDVYAGIYRFIQNTLNGKYDRETLSETEHTLETRQGLLENFEEVRKVANKLSISQKQIMYIVISQKHGVHVSDIADEMDLLRSETVYRVRDLEGDGLVELQNLTDLNVELSRALQTHFENDKDALKRLFT